MEYHGKLYGKVGNKFFDTGKTSDDYATLKQRHDEALELLKDAARLLNNTMEFELVKEYQDKVKEIETLINKNK